MYSVNSKSFNITNGLKQHVLVSLNIDHDELIKSSPQSQVIPPGATAGFDVVFSSTVPQIFYNTISYNINGYHTYIITISAEVTPITLELSKDQLQFKFAPDTFSTTTVSEIVTLSNPFNQRCEFKAIPGSNFSIHPAEGSIKPHGTIDLEVMFHPDTKTRYEESVTIKVNGGPDRVIRCSAKISKANVAISHKLVDFEIISLGLSKRQTLLLQNTVQTDAFFQCEQSETNDLIVSPSSGWIRGGASQELELVLTPLKKFMYDIPVNINIPGGKPLKFKVRGRADVPTVSIQQEIIKFEGKSLFFLYFTKEN